jgi:hypothetical protein
MLSTRPVLDDQIEKAMRDSISRYLSQHRLRRTIEVDYGIGDRTIRPLGQRCPFDIGDATVAREQLQVIRSRTGRITQGPS